MKTLTELQKLNRIYRTYGFFSCKNLRKNTMEEVKIEYIKNKNSSIEGTEDNYSYFIVWEKSYGIRGFVFNENNRLLSYISFPYKNAEEVRNLVIRYIHVISKKLEEYKNKIN